MLDVSSVVFVMGFDWNFHFRILNLWRWSWIKQYGCLDLLNWVIWECLCSKIIIKWLNCHFPIVQHISIINLVWWDESFRFPIWNIYFVFIPDRNVFIRFGQACLVASNILSKFSSLVDILKVEIVKLVMVFGISGVWHNYDLLILNEVITVYYLVWDCIWLWFFV